MKLSLRSTFAALLAALAFACAGLGARDGAEAARRHPPVLRWSGAGMVGLDVQRTLSLAFLHGGRSVLGGAASRPGTLPRVVPGTGPSRAPSCHALYAARPSADGARILSIPRPPFARRLSAMRDGTLSARSTGVPPPALA